MSETTPIRVASVKPAHDFVLQVAFTNGKSFAVDLREPVFRLKALRPLRDPRVFARAEAGEGGFSLVWPGDLDMGADRIYETALEQNGRMDTVDFLRWRWRNGLSLNDAAEALGLTRRTIAYYSSGEQEVPRSILLAIKGWEAERQHAVA